MRHKQNRTVSATLAGSWDWGFRYIPEQTGDISDGWLDNRNVGRVLFNRWILGEAKE